MRQWGWLAVVAWSVLAPPAWVAGQAAHSVASQPVGEPELAKSELDALLVRAVAAYEAADFDAARALFEVVHARAPTARTLRGLALVAYKQQRFEAAVQLFEASLTHAAKPLEGRLRDDALHLLEQARAQLSLREEREPPLQPALDRAPSAASERSAVQLAPAPAPRQVAVAALRGHAQPAQRAHVDRRGLRLKRAGFSLLALSAATLLLTGTAWAIGVERLGGIEQICSLKPSGKCSRAAADDLQRSRRLDLLSALTTAGLVLAASSAASAVTTLTLHYRAAGNDVALGLAAGGRF